MNETIKILATKVEIKTLATKVELKAEQDKIVKLETHDLSYFLGKNFLGDDSFQNMFVYQIALSTLASKKEESQIIFLAGNQKGCVLLNLSHYILLS